MNPCRPTEKIKAALLFFLVGTRANITERGAEMYLFELTKKNVLADLTPEQRRFYSKRLVAEVERVAKAEHLTKEEAYFWISRGLFGGDRWIQMEGE